MTSKSKFLIIAWVLLWINMEAHAQQWPCPYDWSPGTAL